MSGMEMGQAQLLSRLGSQEVLRRRISEAEKRWSLRGGSMIGEGRLRSGGCQGGRALSARLRSGLEMGRTVRGGMGAALQRTSVSRPDLLRILNGLEAMLDI